jgi:hypothetical protein
MRGPGVWCPSCRTSRTSNGPTTNNGNPNYAWSATTGSAAHWSVAYNVTAGAVSVANPLVNNGIAFDRFEVPYATAMLATLLSPIAFLGGDEYTTGISNNATCPFCRELDYVLGPVRTAPPRWHRRHVLRRRGKLRLADI